MTSRAVARWRGSDVAALRTRVYRFAAWHPEWWVAAVAFIAWVVIVAQVLMKSGQPLHHEHYDAVSTGGLATFDRMVSAASAWLLMLAAMMLPVLVPRVRRVASCCVGVVRDRAIAETLAGALLPWCALGVGVVIVVSALPSASAGRVPVAYVVTWLAVAGWQLSPWNWVALRRCCAVQVPRGPEDRSQRVRAGASHSVWCTVSCGPAMVAMAWSGHSAGLMALLTVGLTAERVARRPNNVSRLLAAAVVTTALLEVWVAAGS